MTIPFFVVNAFTREPFAGNPAGVFLDDDACLSGDQMKRLAGEVHLESAFVLPPTPGEPRADFRLRYWTGTMEVPLCGHDTVAVLVALHQSGRIGFETGETHRVFHVQTNVGVLRVEINRAAGDGGVRVTVHQNTPVFGPIPETGAARALRALGAETGDLVRGLPVQVVSTGTPWLLVPVQNRAAVDNAPADLAAITELSKETGTFGAYVFVMEPDNENRPQIWSRCFAPIAGLNEDPVTGSASGAVGAYLARHGVLPVAPNQSAPITAYQGYAGGRGGTAQIVVSRDVDGVLGVGVTGEAVVIGEGQFTLPQHPGKNGERK